MALYEVKNDGLELDEENTVTEVEHLPVELESLMLKRFAAAAVIAVLSVILAVTFKDIKCLLLLVLSAYFLYIGYSIKKDFSSGRILEKETICRSIRRSIAKDSIVVTFEEVEDEDVNSQFHQFTVVGKEKLDEFVIGSGYLLYYEKSNPRALLAYRQI